MKTVNLPVSKVLENLARHLTKFVSTTHKQILRTSVLVEAKNYAAKNLPTPQENSIAPYLNTIKGQYLAMKKYVSVQLRGAFQKFAGAVNLTTLNEKINSLIDTIKKEKEDCQNILTDKNKITTPRNSYKNKYWWLYLFGLAESMLMMSCFLRLGDIVVIAALVGLIIGLAQVIAAKQAVLIIKEIEDHQKRIRYYIFAFLCFSIYSILLGMLRYYIAHTGAAANIPFTCLNPFTFAGINMLLAVASAFLVYFYFPSKSEIAELEELKRLEKQIKQSLGKQKGLQTELDKLVAERVQVTKLHAQAMHDEQQIFGLIEAWYKQSVGSFINENTSKRTDGTFPACFKNTHKPLSDSDENYFEITT
jgi:hypothetical protein